MANIPGLRNIAAKYGVPPGLAEALVRQESGGNPLARSPVGAIGYTQLMPATAASLGVDPHDPTQNLEGGFKYLAQQYKKFGSWNLALAAYNAGPGAVSKYGGVPPYAETQNYVKSIMAMAQQAGGLGNAPAETAPNPGSPAPSISGASPMPSQLQTLLQNAAPQDAGVGILNKLGGMAGRTAQAAQAPIPLPQPKQQAPLDLQSGEDLPQPGDPYTVPHVSVQGATHGGAIPMITGGNIKQQYPQLVAQGQVDWQHINPRLLAILNKEAEKRGAQIVIFSGYRSTDYNKKIGGAEGSNHRKGLAVDAYINGHPIGDVISPEEWAKLGVRSGNTPGFFHGKPDPAHVDLLGIPIKAGG